MGLINKAMAYNFSYLALEYYKKLDLNEEEVMILLIIDQMIVETCLSQLK